VHCALWSSKFKRWMHQPFSCVCWCPLSIVYYPMFTMSIVGPWGVLCALWFFHMLPKLESQELGFGWWTSSLVCCLTLLQFVFGKFFHYGLGVECNRNPKSMSRDHQNSIKTIILLDIFLWCHFNGMLIIKCNVKQLIWMLKNSK